MQKTDHNLSAASGAIRLTLPAKVANNLDTLQQGLKSLAELLGHPACATGCDILSLRLERELILDERMRFRAGPQPDPWLPSDPIPWKTVQVTIPDAVNNDIDRLNKAIGVVMDKLGCAACCSGFDILFRRELNTLALDENLNVVRAGGLR
jgi:hypothetical protein